MDYFVIRPDTRLMYTPELRWPNEGELPPKEKHLDLNPYLSEALLIRLKAHRLNEYPDYMEIPINFKPPVMLISNKLKPIVSKYQRNIRFQMVLFVERKRGHQEIYHVMDVPEVDCLSDNAPRRLGDVTELVLDEDKIGVNRIFRVKDYNMELVIRLDVAESLLRRNGSGVTFEKVKMRRKRDE